MPRHQVEFANVVVRAGESELLDLFDDLVWPALTNKQLKRTHGDSTFFISDCRGFVAHWNGKPQSVVIARIIKTTKLKREQYYDERQGIVADQRTLDSAPSGVFLLILNNHKLIYVHETAHAPPIGQVENTLRRFILATYDQLIRSKFSAHQKRGTPVTQRTLRTEFPRPDVDVIPLPHEGSIAEFINVFDVIKTIEVRLIRPNSEIDLNPFFKVARQEQERLKSKQTTITQRSTEGLSDTEAKRYVTAATRQGNARINVRGTDERGVKISGNNDNFNIKTYLNHVPKSITTIAKRLFTEFQKLAQDNHFPVSQSQDAGKKAEHLAQVHDWPSLQLRGGDDESAD
ncbi:MAG TPA: hypothetical protein VK539_06890 [Myxococcaceae bacterium]|nr:hypothetical protein [Myxococcaceae bacterium]